MTVFKDVYGLVHNYVMYIYVLFILNRLHLSIYVLNLGNGLNLNCAFITKITIYSPKTLNFHRSSEMP